MEGDDAQNIIDDVNVRRLFRGKNHRKTSGAFIVMGDWQIKCSYERFNDEGRYQASRRCELSPF